MNGKLIKPADWLREHCRATSLTSDPTMAEGLTRGVDFNDGAPVPKETGATFNLYRPPTIVPGDARLAGLFVGHVQ